ncbi:unnamed protein product [Urochloa humidicola]
MEDWSEGTHARSIEEESINTNAADTPWPGSWEPGTTPVEPVAPTAGAIAAAAAGAAASAAAAPCCARRGRHHCPGLRERCRRCRSLHERHAAHRPGKAAAESPRG